MQHARREGAIMSNHHNYDRKNSKSEHSGKKLDALKKPNVKILKNTHSMKQQVGGKDDKTIWISMVCYWGLDNNVLRQESRQP